MWSRGGGEVEGSALLETWRMAKKAQFVKSQVANDMCYEYVG